MADELLRGRRIWGGVLDDYCQMRFSEEEFNKIILPFRIEKKEAKDNSGKLIYVSSARTPHHQILKRRDKYEI